MKACSAMSSPRLSNRKHRYDDKLWSTYITEAVQSGNAIQKYHTVELTNNNITNNIHIRIPDTDQHSNLYTTTKGGSLTLERILNFINPVIIKHTDGIPAALFLDAASINRSDATLELCNNNITIVSIPPNTTAWLQPCDVFVFGSAKNKVHKAMKYALNTESILMSCDELHNAIHEMRSEDTVQCWMNIAHQTIDELKGNQLVHRLKVVDLHLYQPNLNRTIL